MIEPKVGKEKIIKEHLKFLVYYPVIPLLGIYIVKKQNNRVL